jgi:hypothetical protein
MQSFGLVILNMTGMTLLAGLSVGLYALYIVPAASMLERTSHHGRHSGFGTRARLRTASALVARMVGVDGRLPQSA